jgi:hypothetical protein
MKWGTLEVMLGRAPVPLKWAKGMGCGSPKTSARGCGSLSFFILRMGAAVPHARITCQITARGDVVQVLALKQPVTPSSDFMLDRHWYQLQL